MDARVGASCVDARVGASSVDASRVFQTGIVAPVAVVGICRDNSRSLEAQHFMDMLTASPGIGTTCMGDYDPG